VRPVLCCSCLPPLPDCRSAECGICDGAASAAASALVAPPERHGGAVRGTRTSLRHRRPSPAAAHCSRRRTAAIKTFNYLAIDRRAPGGLKLDVGHGHNLPKGVTIPVSMEIYIRDSSYA